MRHRCIRKALLGIMAVAPLFSIGLVIVIAMGVRSTLLPLGTFVIMSVAISFVVFVAVLSYFLLLLQRDRSIPESEKARWTLILLLWFPFGVLMFWYRFVWRGSL